LLGWELAGGKKYTEESAYYWVWTIQCIRPQVIGKWSPKDAGHVNGSGLPTSCNEFSHNNHAEDLYTEYGCRWRSKSGQTDF